MFFINLADILFFSTAKNKEIIFFLKPVFFVKSPEIFRFLRFYMV